jgi:hypothetical protein
MMNGKVVIEQTSYIEKNIISLATIQAVLGTALELLVLGLLKKQVSLHCY